MSFSRLNRLAALSGFAVLAFAQPAHAEAPQAYKDEAAANIDGNTKFLQDMVDSVFSFAEPGFQEFKTQEYITDILEKNGFKIEKGVAGIPSAWTATWSNGPGPKIALGADVDGLLGLSQKPGVAEVSPLVPGAPGHGEGHSAGMPVMVSAALALKEVMTKNKVGGTLMIWPGIAEELLATKAYYVREGLFDDVDLCLFTHVGNGFRTGWGPSKGNGMISVEYTFHGKTAHSAGAPWLGKSAADAVDIMNVAWNFKREHLPITQRSHYVVTNGGGQPNIVPDKASVWYYFRDYDFDGIRYLFETGNTIAKAAAMATETTVTQRTLGYAAPVWTNKPLAEAAYLNIQKIGMPEWSAADQQFARSVQEANGLPVDPLKSEVEPLQQPDGMPPRGGGSDDLGAITWTVPTIYVIYPSNIPNVTAHNVTAAMAMATPIAHKGAVVGAKAVAMTALDALTTPELVANAKKYQQEEQFAEQTYDPLITDADMPAIELNKEVMDRMRPEMEKYYYDPSKYANYLEQLGIAYPSGK